MPQVVRWAVAVQGGSWTHRWGSRLMSEESAKAVVATKAGLVWVSDQISDRDVVGLAVRAGTAGAVRARSSEVN